MVLGSVRGCSALRDPICYSLLLCAVSQGLYSLSVPGKQEWAELHEVLRTEIMRKGTCLDSFQWLPSVTPFSDLLLKGSLFSYAPLTQDVECFLALLRLLFAWLCFCSILLLPKAALYEDILTCISANKAPLFHLRLGSPASLFSSTPVPRSRSTKTVTGKQEAALGAAGPLFQGLMIKDTWHFGCIFSTVTHIQTVNLYSTTTLWQFSFYNWGNTAHVGFWSRSHRKVAEPGFFGSRCLSWKILSRKFKA